jgi:hypothetical protein
MITVPEFKKNSIILDIRLEELSRQRDRNESMFSRECHVIAKFTISD